MFFGPTDGEGHGLPVPTRDGVREVRDESQHTFPLMPARIKVGLDVMNYVIDDWKSFE